MFGMFKKTAKKAASLNKASEAFQNRSADKEEQSGSHATTEATAGKAHTSDDNSPERSNETTKERRSSAVVIGGRLGEVAPTEDSDEESAGEVEDGSAFDEDDPMLKEAIIEHCKYLGIDPVTQSEYVWIAKKSMLAPVPEGWEQVIDDNGVPFYHNVGTGESQWEHPDDEHYRRMFKKLLEEDKKSMASKIKKGKGKPSRTKGDKDNSERQKQASEDGQGVEKKQLDESTWDDWDDVEDEPGETTNKEQIGSDNKAKRTPEEQNIKSENEAATVAQQGSENAEWDDWDSGDEDTDSGGTKIKTENSKDPETTVAKEDAETEVNNNKSKKNILESGMFPLKDEQSQQGNSENEIRPESAEQGASGKTSAKEIFVAQAEIKRLTSELEHSQQRLDKSKEDQDLLVSKHRKSIEDVRNDLMASQDRAHAAERRTTEVKVELERVQDELSVYRRQHEGMKSNKAELEDQLSTLKANKSRMEQTITTLRKQVKDLQTSLQRVGSDQDEELAAVKEELKNFKEDNKKLKTELAEVKSLNNTLSASTNRRIQNSMQTARSAQAARKAAEEREKALEKELSTLKAGASKTSKNLENELEAALKRLKKADAARSDAEKLSKEEAGRYTQSIKDLQIQLEQCQKAAVLREKDLRATVERLKAEIASSGKEEVPVSKLEAPKESKKAEDSSEVQEMKKVVSSLNHKLEVTERKLRDAERLTSAAEERADRAESAATESNVENELATSLGIRVYELERDQDKLEASLRDAVADKDLFKTQAEAALRERSQVLDRIKVEQKRNDELVFQRQRLSEEKIKLSAQLEQARIVAERTKEEITTLRDSHTQLNDSAKMVEENKLKFDEVLRDQMERMKKEHDAVVDRLRKELMEERLKINGSSNSNGSQSSDSIIALENQLRSEYELRILALQDELQAVQSKQKAKSDSHDPSAVTTDKSSVSLLSSQIRENNSLRAQVQTLQEQIRRIKRGAEDEVDVWKRRNLDLSAEVEALRRERNERKVELKELREEWKMLHKELRDVKVQELVARETAMRAEAKLEKRSSSDENVSHRMNSFLGDMRTLVEQVASFQRSPARALMDNSSSGMNSSSNGRRLSFSPGRNDVAPPPPVPRYQLHRSSGAPGLPVPSVRSDNSHLLNLSNTTVANQSSFSDNRVMDSSEKTMQSLMERVESERLRSRNARQEVEMLRKALYEQQNVVKNQ